MEKKRCRGSKKKNGLKKLTVGELIETAQYHIDIFEFEQAQKYCKEALRREPDNVTALETSGSLCLEIGNIDAARHCYGRAIALQPSVGYAKYFTMAQLLEGKDTLNCYLKGIEILTNGLKNLTDSEGNGNASEECGALPEEQKESKSDANMEALCKEMSELDPGQEGKEDPVSLRKTMRKDLSSAHCSVAELYMTELCDEDSAEEECKQHISLAIDSDPSNPEPHQQMAGYLLILQKKDEAKESILKSLSLWFPEYKAVLEGEKAGDPIEVCPVSYQSRIASVKVLIEVGEYKTAEIILDGLLQEDDQVVETWYLHGWSQYLQGEQLYPDAKFHLQKALTVHKMEPSHDAGLVEHVQELLKELQSVKEREESEDEDGEELTLDSIESDSDDSGCTENGLTHMETES